jgi:peptidyl-prolyl cis-trans isomerase C
MKRLSLLVLVSTVALGCKPERPNVTEARAEAAAQRAETAKRAAEGDPAALGALQTQTGSDDATRDKIVATIGESSITVGDVLSYIERQPQEMQARYASHDQRKKLLQHLIDMELLAREGRERGLSAHPVVRQTLKQTLARQLLLDLDGQGAGPGSIDDTAVKAYYDGNQERFVRPEKRRAAWIMVRTKEDAVARRAELMAAIAENPNLARQVFGDFAAKYSVDGDTKALRGDMGWFFEDGHNEAGQVRVDAAGAKAVFGLEAVNSVTSPVELSGKIWAIVQLTNLHPRVVRALDEVKMEIRNRLLRQEQSKRRRTFIDSLKAKATIEIDEAALGALPSGKSAQEIRLPDPEQVKALSLGKGVAPVAQPTKGAATSDPKQQLHPSATRKGLVHRFRGKPLTVQRPGSKAEQKTVKEVQDKMRRKKAGE